MKRLTLIVIWGICCTTVFPSDSIKSQLTHFVAAHVEDGVVFPTNDFVSGEYRIPYYTSLSLKYGIASKEDTWQEYAYGLPYIGFGLYAANFHREKDLGIPFSLFFLQGAEIHRFIPAASLNYEWNLGASFNWKHYDAFDNPDNIALGSSVNIHVGGNIFVKWRVGQKWDLNAGIGVTHFSNGASSFPNKGLNMANYFMELAYHFNRGASLLQHQFHKYEIPVYNEHLEHDVMFMVTSRHARVDTLNTGLPDIYSSRNFKVLGVTYSCLISNGYRYKWGPSIESVYDESSGIVSWREQHPKTKRYYDRTRLGNFGNRFSIGLSLKGELSMPYYSVFANLGYDVIHGNEKDKRLYQILGVKVYLKDNLFGTFGIRAYNLGRAEYLYWNLGYTIFQEKKR